MKTTAKLTFLPVNKEDKRRCIRNKIQQIDTGKATTDATAC
jgi:hypothetical protein